MNRPIRRGDVFSVAATMRQGAEIFPATHITITEALPFGTDRYAISECDADGKELPVRHGLELGGPELRWLIECGQWAFINTQAK